jgi:predicted RNase H-like HicB family nuclease
MEPMAPDKLELTVDISPEKLSTGEQVYVATFREVELASQGSTVEEAMENAIEAMNLLIEHASASELERRLPSKPPRRRDVYTRHVEIALGKTQSLIGV